MKRVLAAAAAALSVVVATTAQASAVVVGPLAVTTSSLAIATSYSCASVPLTWYLSSAPEGVDTWYVGGDIVDGTGASRGLIFEYEQLPVTQASDTFSICNLAEGVNTFTVAVDVDAWTPSFTMYSTRFVSTLTITRTTPAPPPPPPPAPPAATSVRFDGRPIWFERSKYARIGALVEITSTCSEPRTVTLAASKGGGWRALGSDRGYSSAYLKVRVPYKYKRVRLEVAGTAKCVGAISRSVKVPKRPAR